LAIEYSNILRVICTSK